MFKPKLFTALKTYNKETFTSDLFSGLTVGVVALPLAMAFAIASGVGPEKGLFTAIVAGFLISFFGGSKVQIGGPTGAFVVLVAEIMEKYGYSGLVYATIMAGIFLIIFGISKMGGIIRFIPFPVTTGFTSGIAVVIFSTQIKDFFGIKMATPPADFILKWKAYAANFSSVNLSALSIGIFTIIIIIAVKKLFPKIPAMLIGMIISTILAYALGLNIETIGSKFGDLPRTLPAPSIPKFDIATIKMLASPAFTVAMLAAIESLLSATVADGMTGDHHRSNTELIAQGIANIGSAIFGGIPATGAIARTATNIKSGGKSPVSGIIHAVTLALILLFLSPLAKLIPLATLAAILIVVSYNMAEIKHFKAMFKAPKSDLSVLLITFLLTVFIDLTVAVQVGIALAAILFIKRMAEVANVGMITKSIKDDGSEATDINSITKREVPEEVEVFEINGPFFFGAASKFKNSLKLDPLKKILILRMRDVPAIDATGLQVLRELNDGYRKSDMTLILSGVHAQPVIALNKCGLWKEIGEENIFGNIDDALNRAREILSLPKKPLPKHFVASVSREKNKEN